MRLSPRPLPTAVVPLVVTLAAAACGAADEAPSHGSVSPDTFPVTLTRQGGVAGFLQSAVVSEDGEVRLTGHDDGGTCQLEPGTVQQLAALARTATGTATTTPAHPDDLVVALQTPEGSRRLTDAELSGGAAVVVRLLDDAGKAPAERTLCR